MSDLIEKTVGNFNNKQNIIKLKVAGGSSVINTIEDQRLDRGLSLVCPFPALEVDIPVTLTGKNGEPSEGRIHRIGVEDDPETGLPKLRLSVRNVLGFEVSEDKPVEQVKPVKPVNYTPEVKSAGDAVTNNSGILLDGILDDVLDNNTSELLNWDDSGELNIKESDEDPGWAQNGPVFSYDVLDGAPTRRRRVAGAVAAWSLVMGIAAGGMYTLARAGVVNVDNIKGKIFAIGGRETSNSIKSDSLALLQKNIESSKAVSTVKYDNKDDGNVALKSQDMKAGITPASSSVKLINADNIKKSGELSAKSNDSVDDADKNAGISGEKEIKDSADSKAEEVVRVVPETQITLPTRWPAEFLTSYRLQNPNGVVIDIPGGLVKREGWITVSKNEKIIKSVKAIQRESGARFIIYVKGDLPNFKTKSIKEGIRLNLYYDDLNGSEGAAQEIAMR